MAVALDILRCEGDRDRRLYDIDAEIGGRPRNDAAGGNY